MSSRPPQLVAMPLIASLATRVYYRLAITGGRVPPRGPVLLVANHTNMALDPALVVAAARRPVRFLAKAPLFDHPLVGGLLRAAGAIPVYRHVDDPTVLDRNQAVFRAVRAALANGSAVGIFPEGKSHSDPTIAPLKTGAARIALGTGPKIGGAFPIVPVGLVFRRKEEFRSDALVVVGNVVAWDDLAPCGETDAGAVRALTERIEAALRDVTINLEQWEDSPIVEAAEAIHAAELGAARDPGDRLERLRETTEILARLRREGDRRWTVLADDVAEHTRQLHQLGLRPGDLHASPRLHHAFMWTLRQLVHVALPSIALGVLGQAIFWPPYRLTRIIEGRMRPAPDARSTVKLFLGAALHLIWIAILAALVGWLAGFWAALAVFIVLPVLGLLVLAWQHRWSTAVAEARRFLLLRRRRDWTAELAERQHRLAERLERVRSGW